MLIQTPLCILEFNHKCPSFLFKLAIGSFKFLDLKSLVLYDHSKLPYLAFRLPLSFLYHLSQRTKAMLILLYQPLMCTDTFS